ncbi:MAG: lamin tail domain-containing protein [Anaerolineae bacterium]|jgi:hypothetical protein|nr:lamin tail domain-containing protein [Anaerolineae bacterium]
MKMMPSSKSLQKRLRWSATLLLAGFLLGSLLPSFGRRVEAAPRRASVLDVVINEIAWGGTTDYSGDEWIELYNPTSNSIDITGWILIADGADPKLNITLIGDIPAGGYFLLERTNDDTISDIEANQIYSFTDNALSNDGEILRLFDLSSTEIDTANIDGGDWPAGSGSPDYISMERTSVILDGPTAWANNDGVTINGIDGDSPPNPIHGTPKQPNSVNYFSPVINEIAWAGTIASSSDEWIEIYNPNSSSIDLTGWRLVAEDGNPNISLSGTIAGNSYFLLERAHDNVISDVSANQIYFGDIDDNNETLYLLDNSSQEVDTANQNGGAWSHGSSSPASSMERMSNNGDTDENWVTNNGAIANGKDNDNNDINGSPGQENWGYSVTHTPIPTSTYTPTATPITPTTQPTTIFINEVAWMGTNISSSDEWIELYNPSSTDFDLEDWTITATDGSPSIITIPSGIIQAGGYFLLERSEKAVNDISADYIYGGNNFSNSGEILELKDSSGTLIDSANTDGGAWPAGASSSGTPSYASMERNAYTTENDSLWTTNDGITRNGLDANGDPINGTPTNSSNTSGTATPSLIPSKTPIPPTGTPTAYPFQSVVLNEILPRPAHDWNGDGTVDINDEFIEIINRGDNEISLSSWNLEILSTSAFYKLPNISISSGERVVIFGEISLLPLSDGGDTVRLVKSNNEIADVVSYTSVKAADYSWCRYPEHGFWNTNCFPTPKEENALQGELLEETSPADIACSVPDTVPEVITFIECGYLSTNIIDADFWDKDTLRIWISGRAKHPTWVQ